MMENKRDEGYVSYADLCFEQKQAEESDKEISHIYLTNESMQKMRNEPDVTLGSEESVGRFGGTTLYVGETNVIVFEDGTKKQL